MTKVKKSKKAKESVSHNHRSEKLPLPFDVVEYVDALEDFVGYAMPLLARNNVFNDENIEEGYVGRLLSTYELIHNVKNTLEDDGYNFNPMSDEHILGAPWICDSCKSEIKERLAR